MKKVLVLFLFLPFLLITIALSFAPSPVRAQVPSPSPKLDIPDEAPPTGVNMTLSPVFLNLSTDPGKAITSQFRVTNNNNFSEYLEVVVRKFVSGDQGPVIQDVSEEDEFADWVSFSEKQFQASPNQTKTIRFTISPPEEASLGYYYSFVIQRITDIQATGQGAAIAGAPALPVLLEVKSPNAKREIQIVDFKTDKPFYEYLPSNFIITVKNSGNVHIAPSGDIFIDSMFNKDVSILPANKGRGNILPNGQREFTASWDDGFAVRTIKTKDGKEVRNAKGEIEYETSYDFSKANKFRVGRYTANLIMVYDNGERDIPIEAKISFWVIPWKIFLGVFLIIVTPAVLVYLVMRRRYGRR